MGTPQKTLAELTETPQYGFTASSSIEPIGPKFVRITDIQDGAINWDSVPYCQCQESDKYLLRPNDILFARTGATTGKTYLVKETPFAIFASYLIRIRPKSDINPAYLYSFFQSNLYWYQIAVEKEGSAQPNVNGKKLSSVEMPIVNSTLQSAIATFLQVVRDRQDGSKEPLPELPHPLAEQRRIVARIEGLAAKIEEARGLRKTAGEEIEALFESAVGATFNQLKSVERKKLSTLTSKIGSGSTPKGGRASYPSSGIPFIRSLNVRMRNFQWDDIAFIDTTTHGVMRGTIVKPNDVLLNITGASIGRVACAPSDLAEANVNQHVAIIRPIEKLNPRYLMYWLSQPEIQEFINDKQKGATRQGFTKAQIEAFEVSLPPLPEQRRIVTYLDELQAKVDALRRFQTETGAEMDAMLPAVLDRAFKGEL